MAETACGKLRLPFEFSAPQSVRDCEQACWDTFAQACAACTTQECIDLHYEAYLQCRAHCAESSGLNPWDGLARFFDAGAAGGRAADDAQARP